MTKQDRKDIKNILSEIEMLLISNDLKDYTRRDAIYLRVKEIRKIIGVK
jgi:hypothetical protein